MSEASFASLGPTLLARKGGAKPAMRPQLTPLPDNLSEMAALAEEQLEDLGWNDMGADRDPDGSGVANALLLSSKPVGSRDETSADVVPIDKTAPRPAPAPAPANEDTPESETPKSHSQQGPRARPIERETAKGVTAASSQARTPIKSGRRAAFTLRLDSERHLKLRLAATMQGVSAQSLVTEALDAMLNGIQELDTLVERMQRD